MDPKDIELWRTLDFPYNAVLTVFKSGLCLINQDIKDYATGNVGRMWNLIQDKYTCLSRHYGRLDLSKFDSRFPLNALREVWQALPLLGGNLILLEPNIEHYLVSPLTADRGSLFDRIEASQSIVDRLTALGLEFGSNPFYNQFRTEVGSDGRFQHK